MFKTLLYIAVGVVVLSQGLNLFDFVYSDGEEGISERILILVGILVFFAPFCYFMNVIHTDLLLPAHRRRIESIFWIAAILAMGGMFVYIGVQKWVGIILVLAGISALFFNHRLYVNYRDSTARYRPYRTVPATPRSDYDPSSTGIMPARVLLHWMWIELAISIALAYALPESVISNWRGLGRFAEVIANHVPMIDALSPLSRLPQVTKVFLAIHWTAIVPVTCAMFLFCRLAPNPHMRTSRFSVWIAPFICLPMCLMYFASPLIFSGTNGCSDHIVEQVICWAGVSRFWLGLMGGLGSYFFSAALILGVLRWPWIAKRIS